MIIKLTAGGKVDVDDSLLMNIGIKDVNQKGYTAVIMDETILHVTFEHVGLYIPQHRWRHVQE